MPYARRRTLEGAPDENQTASRRGRRGTGRPGGGRAELRQGPARRSDRWQLTIGTDKPAYPPWFSDDDPTNGKGFESAVAYAVAAKLGFTKDEVAWEVAPFNTVIQPGDKKFDFDINQVSISDERKKAVDFSSGYYDVTQAVIALNDSKIAGARSIADLKGPSSARPSAPPATGRSPTSSSRRPSRPCSTATTWPRRP
jgi:polar amino acid transport system substrate-binding protein